MEAGCLRSDLIGVVEPDGEAGVRCLRTGSAADGERLGELMSAGRERCGWRRCLEALGPVIQFGEKLYWASATALAVRAATSAAASAWWIAAFGCVGEKGAVTLRVGVAFSDGCGDAGSAGVCGRRTRWESETVGGVALRRARWAARRSATCSFSAKGARLRFRGVRPAGKGRAVRSSLCSNPNSLP